ncbi:MAG: adenylate/guanylate cyclase domain-containing protein [Rhizobiales bacterium]|nr:adenylate/guanylate cyclase domain-containing protein [Hyphomicrobiales bacterium]
MFADGTLAQRLRLISGLILFAFVLTHFLNHALGLISLDAMEWAQSWRRGFWRSAPGTLALYGALLVHVTLALARIITRRTWRMAPWEALQLLLGLAIPYQLMVHVLATRGMHQQFGFNDTYANELALLWPGAALAQTVLLFLVWTHAVIGIHFWLRIRPWYRRLFLPLFALAVLIPVLSTAGWIVAARQVVAFIQTTAPAPEQVAAFFMQVDTGTKVILALLGALALSVVVPRLLERVRPRIAVNYPGGRDFKVVPGPTLLEISRMLGIPHAAVCGGRARCSTCRVEILSGRELLEPPSSAEQSVLERISAEEHTRLACQIKPRADISIQPLVAAREAELSTGQLRDAYHWGIERPVAIMFVDMRNFTGFAEARLPFDVVFVLNRYLGLVADAITENGGQIDKFIGDGVMAIFGMSEGHKVGSVQALRAIDAIGAAVEALNRELGSSLEAPIRIGVGVHAGPAILGRIGAAASERKGVSQSITALGDTVNAAARLETATKELSAVAVISHAVVHASGLKLDGGAAHEITVKGRGQPLKVQAFADFASFSTALEGSATG